VKPWPEPIAPHISLVSLFAGIDLSPKN